MRPDFLLCKDQFFAHSHDIYKQYLYRGGVQGILADQDVRPDLITLEGCKKVCGTGVEYYSWEHSSSTILHWVLPVTGLLIEAPWETHRLSQAFLVITRWIGSPIASLSYTLANVRVGEKCAMLMDMAVDFDEYPEQETAFAHSRDSFYILSVINHYGIVEDWHSEAHRLLKIALFEETLDLSPFDENDAVRRHQDSSLVTLRRKLAQELRCRRHKGVVPIFLIVLWFLFALEISIQSAFGQVGANRTAHDLAMGLLLSWLPVLILVSVIDRNHDETHWVEERLNHFASTVQAALLRPGPHWNEDELSWIEGMRNKHHLFAHYAGQGRHRWHRGIAHSILEDVEQSLQHRGWLYDSHTRSNLTNTQKRSNPSSSMVWGEEVSQMAGSIVIIGGTTTGAFILSCT